MHLHCHNFSTFLLAYTACVYCPANQMPKGTVYNNFTKSGDNVYCNCCDKTYKKTTATSSTNLLWLHFKAVHSITPAEKRASAANKPKVQQVHITIFVRKKESARDVLYAQVAGAERLSLNQIAD